jgi:hypothetical protein
VRTHARERSVRAAARQLHKMERRRTRSQGPSEEEEGDEREDEEQHPSPAKRTRYPSARTAV